MEMCTSGPEQVKIAMERSGGPVAGYLLTILPAGPHRDHLNSAQVKNTIQKGKSLKSKWEHIKLCTLRIYLPELLFTLPQEGGRNGASP